MMIKEQYIAIKRCWKKAYAPSIYPNLMRENFTDSVDVLKY